MRLSTRLARLEGHAGDGAIARDLAVICQQLTRAEGKIVRLAGHPLGCRDRAAARIDAVG